MGPLSPLEELNRRIVDCTRCPRLREYCAEVARVRKRAFRDQEYWGRPVPSFGDERARVLALGLAPGAHGSNRTGRPFTGDGSGEFLFPALYRTGFASAPKATGREDGLRLMGLWISSVGRCAPPANKPTREELANCAPFLDEEIRLLTELRVVVCLGAIAYDGLMAWARRTGKLAGRAPKKFSHAAEFAFAGGPYVVACYHPSLQNTLTGRLTPQMLDEVFGRARVLAGMRAG
jgi:uracil-DNA glycosylase family 4